MLRKIKRSVTRATNRWHPLAALRAPTATPEAFSPLATHEDVRYCYRLILQREPDPEGWQNITKLVDRGTMTIDQLASIFLNSSEFRSRTGARHEPVAVDLGPYTVYTRSDDWAVGDEVARNKSYEPHVTAELRAELAPGKVFVDVGANIGYFTLLAASIVGEGGRVLAFEPNPENCELLRLSLAANHFDNVILYPHAVAAEERLLALDVVGSSSNGSVRVPACAGDTIVSSVTLDGCLADEPRIDIIKMDIEGFEGHALAGMTKLIEKFRPIIFTEYSPDALLTQSQMSGEAYLQRIQALGYDLFVLPRKGARSAEAQSIEQITAAVAATRDASGTHLDLVAYPRQ